MQIHISKNAAEAKKLARQCEQGTLRRIYHGIYTDDLSAPLETVVEKYWSQIVAHIVTKGILSFRTAKDLMPIPFEKHNKIVFVTSTYVKTIKLPGLIVKVLKGDNESFTEGVFPHLARSNVPRFLLENLTTVRGAAYKGIKTIGEENVEEFLAKELRVKKEKGLNQLRDEAKEIAEKLQYPSEYKKLSSMISALLSTCSDKDALKTNYAKAFARNEPYDRPRIQLFENLSAYLQKCKFKERRIEFSLKSLRHLSFFESYFSNFIEGTEFTIDEAEDIAFSGREINDRHADSHDIMANYQLTNDSSEMNITPKDPAHFLDIIKYRHEIIMSERPEKSPGQFKLKRNQAGNTTFVEPEDVVGTLCQAFPYYALLEEGLPKALFMQFLISEVHPFEDGNGRLSRIMMNAELFQAGLCKIIIPTAHRDNYLNGLRRASRDQKFYTFCKVLDQAQAYTHIINWIDYSQAREKIEKEEANKSADEGLPTFNRAIRLLELSDIPAL